MIKGSCHCKSILFDINENQLSVRYCYCETCRKLSGANYSAAARVDREKFQVTQGADQLLTYESLPGKLRYYCPTCFAPIYVTTNNESSFLRVRVGLLDNAPTVHVTGHMWVSEKPDSCVINDTLPIYSHEYTGN